ncbi:Rieske (2Fe-2S) protein [Granulicoccus sp. GXG6511]|uniref:Rieske (2Fe-2S) protein n=1 Tax=Granulicoccus sp. GXG6511 TaxID=3381351 RepID=UPI003D7DFB4C
MTESSPTTPTSSGPSRRQVLRGGAAVVAGVGAAATLSACAGGSAGGATAEGPRTLDNPVTVPKTEVPVGSGVIKPDERLVVTQPAEGEFHAFSAVCPHQGCLVSLIRNDSIVCACHTSLFALTDGSRVSGPAQTGLPALKVTDDGDNVRVG